MAREDDAEARFKTTCDALFSLSATLIDTLENIFKQKARNEEANVIVDKLPIFLTELETSCLIFLAKGRSNQEIADMMNVSINTVHFHLKKVYKKLDVSTRAEAIATAIDHGYVTR